MLIRLALLPALLVGCGADEQDLTFLVRDQEDDLPVEGVEIREVGDDRRLGTTDANGRCTIRVKPPGDGALRFRLSMPESSEGATYEFESVYEVDGAALASRVKTIRVRPDYSQIADRDTVVTLQITSTPPGAQVLVDDAPQGETPLIATLPPDVRLRIAVKLAGHATWEQEVVLEAGEQYVDVALQRLEEAKAALIVTSRPAGAEISLNGRRTGRVTPAEFSDLRPGRHQVRLTMEGHEPFATEVELRAGGPPGSAGGVLRPRATAQQPVEPVRPQQPASGKQFLVSVTPGWAEVYVDGGSRNHNTMGNFRIRLSEGTHWFHVINANAGVNCTMDYTVTPGDPNRVLVLDYSTGKVEARP